MKKVTRGFTDFKSTDANKMGLLSFCFVTGLLLLCAVCVIYLVVIEGKVMEALITSFITLAGEVITGVVTLLHAVKIEADAERNDAEAVKTRKIKGKKQGYTLFCIFFIVILVSAILFSDLV